MDPAEVAMAALRISSGLMIVTIVVAIIAAFYTGSSAKSAGRSATAAEKGVNAAETSAEAAKRSAVAAESTAEASHRSAEAAEQSISAATSRWLAINKPFLSISFYDHVSGHSGKIGIKNFGRIPCQIVKACLAELPLDDITEDSPLVSSTKRAKLKQSYILPNEERIYEGIDILNTAKDVTGSIGWNYVQVVIVYRYDPDYIETVIYDVFREDTGGLWKLILVDSSREPLKGNRIRSCDDINRS